jgi:hypothetical protein
MDATESVSGHERPPKCGGTNRAGKPCGNPAGYKTGHVGAGNCTFHGGSTPTGRKSAAEQAARKAVETYGLRRDISATDALIEEVQWTAGHVAWLRERVREVENGDLIWDITEQVEKKATEFTGVDTTYSAAANMWLELYYRERKHLVDVCKAAISAGIEERRVKLAEAQGAIVVDVIRRILARLELSEGQSRLVPVVVPDELRRAAALALN